MTFIQAWFEATTYGGRRKMLRGNMDGMVRPRSMKGGNRLQAHAFQVVDLPHRTYMFSVGTCGSHCSAT